MGRQTDVWSVRWIDVHLNKQMKRERNGQERQMDWKMYEWTNGYTDMWTHRWTDRWSRHMGRHMEDRGMDRHMSVYINSWMERQTDIMTDRQPYKWTYS
jgi:hypothetical protein